MNRRMANTHGVSLPAGHSSRAENVANGNIDATDHPDGSLHHRRPRADLRGRRRRSEVEIDAWRCGNRLQPCPGCTRARAKDRMVVRGTLQDVDASTISGALDVASAGILRGQFASVSGDIRYAGAPPPRAILDFSDHSGAVDIALSRSAAQHLRAFSTVAGTITTGFAQISPCFAGRTRDALQPGARRR